MIKINWNYWRKWLCGKEKDVIKVSALVEDKREPNQKVTDQIISDLKNYDDWKSVSGESCCYNYSFSGGNYILVFRPCLNNSRGWNKIHIFGSSTDFFTEPQKLAINYEFEQMESRVKEKKLKMSIEKYSFPVLKEKFPNCF